MSKYKKIATEFRNIASLLAALKDIGFDGVKVELAEDVKVNSLGMYGYHGDLRPETCAVRIPRHYVGNVSNDVGFEWTGQNYQAIVSEYDQSATFTEQRMNQLKQRYALHEIRRQAKAKGYTLREFTQPDGVMRITCVRR